MASVVESIDVEEFIESRGSETDSGVERWRFRQHDESPRSVRRRDDRRNR